jgi:hypothetical protein
MTEPLDKYPWGDEVEEAYIVPTENIFNFKPNYNITFHQVVDGMNSKEVGRLDFNGPEFKFEGDMEESAKSFMIWIAQVFAGRLKEERNKVRMELAFMLDKWENHAWNPFDCASAIRETIED